MDRVFSFLLWPKREARGPWKQGRKKRGSITYRTDRANEANKMFIIWLCWLFRFWKGDRELEVRTATYGPEIDQSQHVKSVSHIIKYNTSLAINMCILHNNFYNSERFEPRWVSVVVWVVGLPTYNQTHSTALESCQRLTKDFYKANSTLPTKTPTDFI